MDFGCTHVANRFEYKTYMINLRESEEAKRKKLTEEEILKNMELLWNIQLENIRQRY
jgi:hypothetical protein